MSVEPHSAVGLPSSNLTPETYLTDRVDDQIQWYRDRAEEHERSSFRILITILIANIAAAVLGLMQWQAWVGVITTLVGALTAYAAFTISDFLATSYRSTAQQLENLKAAWSHGSYSAEADAFERFVLQVEQVIAREHGGWTAVLRTVPPSSSGN